MEALTNYFTPKQNREYEIYVFRQAKQQANESLAAFHTRLRQLAVTCEFDDVDREIKTQIVQSCSSHKLRTKALENPSYTLTQLLDAGKAMELSKTQAANIADNQSVNKLSPGHGNRRRRNRKSSNGGRKSDKKPGDRKSRNSGYEDRKSSPKCENCSGKIYCPAYQAICRGSGKLNHFEAVCRSQGKGESSNARSSTVHRVGEEVSNVEDEVYTFSLNTIALKGQPFFKIKVHGTPVTMMVDSGASINILDEKEYHRLPSRPNLEPSSVKIYGHQSKVPFRVLGKFTTTLESEAKKLSNKFYVVEGI